MPASSNPTGVGPSSGLARQAVHSAADGGQASVGGSAPRRPDDITERIARIGSPPLAAASSPGPRTRSARLGEEPVQRQVDPLARDELGRNALERAAAHADIGLMRRLLPEQPLSVVDWRGVMDAACETQDVRFVLRLQRTAVLSGGLATPRELIVATVRAISKLMVQGGPQAIRDSPYLDLQTARSAAVTDEPVAAREAGPDRADRWLAHGLACWEALDRRFLLPAHRVWPAARLELLDLFALAARCGNRKMVDHLLPICLANTALLTEGRKKTIERSVTRVVMKLGDPALVDLMVANGAEVADKAFLENVISMRRRGENPLVLARLLALPAIGQNQDLIGSLLWSACARGRLEEIGLLLDRNPTSREACHSNAVRLGDRYAAVRALLEAHAAHAAVNASQDPGDG